MQHHISRYITIEKERVVDHLQDGFTSGKVYEVLAIDRGKNTFYVRNDRNEMIPICSTRCVQIHSESENEYRQF